MKQLCQERLIAREPGSGTRRCIEQALEKKHVPPSDLKIAMEVNSNDAIRAAIKRGVGVAFLSKKTNVNVDGLALVAVRGFRPVRQLYLICQSQQKSRPPATQFLSFIDEWRRSYSE